MSRYKQPYTLYKRGKYWYYRTYTPDGVRTSAKTTGQTSKPLAKKYCDDLFLSGMLWTSSRNFGEYAAHFYDDDSLYFKDRIEPVSRNTRVNYQKTMRTVLLPYFKDVRLCDITYSKLKQFRSHLIDEGYAPMSIQSIMSVLKHVIDTAYRDRLIPVNPYSLLEPLKMKQRPRDAFSVEEVRILYSSIIGEFKPTVLLLALTGLRISECIGLGWEDVKVSEAGTTYICIDKQLNHGEYSSTKTKAVRDVPILPELADLIGFEPTRLSAFYRYFNPIKDTFRDAKARKLCIHSLRHFFITDAKAFGIQERKVEHIAGHVSHNKIERTYTHFKVDDVTEILEWQREVLKKVRDIDNAPD